MRNLRPLFALPALVAMNLCATACDVDDHNHSHDHEGELITTVEATFTPTGAGDTVVATWADVELDGNPVIGDITLANGTDYTLTLRFLNEAEDEPEDITAEIAGENDEHQVFLTGSGVQSEATGTNADAVITAAYGDEDAAGNPVGLEHDVTATATGTGDLRITLRHLPVEDGTALKTSTLADDAANGGISSLPGDSDVDVTFSVTVE